MIPRTNMVVFMVPPARAAELDEDLTVLRAACAQSSDPLLVALSEVLSKRAVTTEASVDDVAKAWRGALDDASKAIVELKKSLAAHIRARTEPPTARDELRRLAAAVDAVKRRRELKRSKPADER